ncbi:DNA topoisomerase IB [soil metagenome]
MARVQGTETGADAATANLHYVSDDQSGITRHGAGTGFSYRKPDGETIRDPAVRERIEQLAIPPAWTDVWICPSPDGHIQATGRDDRDRKQYIYHEHWRAVRDANKFDRLVAFAEVLPVVREHTDCDLRKRGLPREKVLAGVVRLLEKTLIRVGNQEYAKVNQSFGLTTLRSKHVDLEGSHIHFHFNGKGGKDQDIDVRDRRLASLVKKCLEIPGYEVFRYVDDDGRRRLVESTDVNEYLREVSGKPLTSKDFRTWGGTLIGARELARRPEPSSDRETTATITEVIETVAEHLGNTPAVCRKCYVHPAILDAYQDGSLQAAFESIQSGAGNSTKFDLEADEKATLSILKKRPAIKLVDCS